MWLRKCEGTDCVILLSNKTILILCSRIALIARIFCLYNVL